MQKLIVSMMVLGLCRGIAAAAEPPVATVGGQPITRAQLEAHVKPKLVEIDNQRYEALQEGLDELIADQLFAQEAKARGITPEALLQKEITEKVPPPSDADVQKVYDDNKAEIGNTPLETIKPRIVEYLLQQGAMNRRTALVTELKGKYKTTVALQPPVIDVGTGGRPERGGKNATVTIIEFSDYECPFCKRAEASVEQVLTKYGDKVRFVYRDFPLPMHANARPAAEAAHCAQAQGKFWEYHAKLFASSDLSADKLKALATEVGLDRTKFDECVAKQEFKAAVDKDAADGADAGVNGTPAFFINGRMLSGAQPLEKFQEVIDEELARSKNAKPS